MITLEASVEIRKEMSTRMAADDVLSKIAKEEVNEFPEKRQQDIETLRNRLLLHPGWFFYIIFTPHLMLRW